MAKDTLSVTAIFHVTFATSLLSFLMSGFLIWNLRAKVRDLRHGNAKAANSVVYPIYEYILWTCVVINALTILVLGGPGPYPRTPSWFIAANYKEAPHGWDASFFYFIYWLLFEVMANGFGMLFLHPGPSRHAFAVTLQYSLLYGMLSAGLTTFAFNYSGLDFTSGTQMLCDTLFLVMPCALFLLLLFTPRCLPRRVAVHPYAIFSLIWRVLTVIALHAGVLGTFVGAVIVIFRSVGLPLTMYTTLAMDTRMWWRMGAPMLHNIDVIAVAVSSRKEGVKTLGAAGDSSGDERGEPSYGMSTPTIRDQLRRRRKQDPRRLVTVSPQGIVRWSSRPAPKFTVEPAPTNRVLALSEGDMPEVVTEGGHQGEASPSILGYVSPEPRRRRLHSVHHPDSSLALSNPPSYAEDANLRAPLLTSESEAVGDASGPVPRVALYGSLGPSRAGNGDSGDVDEFVYSVRVARGSPGARASPRASVPSAPSGAPADAEDGDALEIACVRELRRENQAYLVHFAYLEKGRELDEGASSIVYAGVYYDWSGVADASTGSRRQCVIRQVAIKQFTPKRGLSDEVVAKYHVENQISAAFSHPNIVKYYGLCVDPPHISLVFELCEQGNLFKMLGSRHREPLSWATKLRMATDGAEALAYLHSFTPVYLHRDIKSPNFLVTADWVMKLSDFGESRLNSAEAANALTGLVGTPQWMAPEMMARKPYNQAVDVYSYGIVLWELLTEQQPFAGLNHGAIFHAVLIKDERPPVPAQLEAAHPEYVALMRRCWAKNPESRPTADEVLECLLDLGPAASPTL